MFFQFIQPCHPQRAKTVPAGDDWQHEIKFDGFRVQIHKLGNEVELFSRNGSRFSRRFPRLVSVLREHVWAFDLLALNRKDLRKWSLEARQGRPQTLVSRFDSPVLLHSEAFDDGEALLRVAEKHGLEGVVSKRRDAPYRSGACRGWRKVKTTVWREANRERWRLFETPGR
jgi:bifunctional non-homologous end joining protein LigD